MPKESHGSEETAHLIALYNVCFNSFSYSYIHAFILEWKSAIYTWRIKQYATF